MYTYLIVDDEMIERKGIRMLLSRMNIRENILEASNGEEALEVFEKEKIDVLLTDINMPFMDGIELLSRIHEEYPGTETVIFSGYDEFSYAKKAISYGVSAYILKPVNPEEFKKVVGEITEKLAKSEREEKRKDESMEFLREHLLYLMVNGQSRSTMQEKTQMLLDMSFVRDFCRMVLLECANNYFEQVNSDVKFDRLLAVILAFIINYACYFSEIYRGGIESIPKGQYEAGQVLGMTKAQIFFKVVLFQVIKRIVPPMGNEIITLVKDTSLARVIAVVELVKAAETIVSLKSLIWPLFYVGAFYLLFTGIVTLLLNYAEKKLNYYQG